MGFLVGNDFIPHLPHMHIHHECLPLLWKTYKSVLPKLDGQCPLCPLQPGAPHNLLSLPSGYLHDAGKLNLARFEEFLQVLSLVSVVFLAFQEDSSGELHLRCVFQNDFEKFNEMYSDLLWLQSKKGQSSGFGSERPTNKEVRAKRTKVCPLMFCHIFSIPLACKSLYYLSCRKPLFPAKRLAFLVLMIWSVWKMKKVKMDSVMLSSQVCPSDSLSILGHPMEKIHLANLLLVFHCSAVSMDQDDGEEAVGNLGKELEKDEYFMSEFSKFKEKYYTEKLEYPCVTWCISCSFFMD